MFPTLGGELHGGIQGSCITMHVGSFFVLIWKGYIQEICATTLYHIYIYKAHIFHSGASVDKKMVCPQ